MKEDCEKLTTALTQQAQRHAKEIQTREEHWLNEHKRIQKLSETAQIRVGLLEGEKEINIASRREVDILRARNLELEEKYRRIEQQAKSRFLRDKTNCLATVVQEDAMSGSGKQASIPETSIVDTSVVEQPTANAPIFPMHHRIPAVPIHAAIRQGGGSKLHEPGCSINSHRWFRKFCEFLDWSGTFQSSHLKANSLYCTCCTIRRPSNNVMVFTNTSAITIHLVLSVCLMSWCTIYRNNSIILYYTVVYREQDISTKILNNTVE